MIRIIPLAAAVFAIGALSANADELRDTTQDSQSQSGEQVYFKLEFENVQVTSYDYTPVPQTNAIAVESLTIAHEGFKRL